ncbi:4-vinyl reductase [Geobacter pelophilus]|uniref:4-vinyl reductase n=1 Tax=Geoanaerobacter pelophilus TaxID=60036 RepID=A0AAW4L0U7_9BACT|nr:V4R domain-containing protein [Geoanaerobacter pelophilus]MBT0664684.1 4-vinyl reductase [Geoanaerobacter pelophilus]
MGTDSCCRFNWKQVGDIALGRPHLGPMMHLAVYRLMQYTLREAICARYGHDEASDLLRSAGLRAGEEFCANVLNSDQDFNGFVAELQEKLREMGVGILRIEKADMEKLNFTLTVGEDLDCSGLPVVGHTVCEYDEGFIAGVLGRYTGKAFEAKEVDCWATGERTCRFSVTLATADGADGK